MTKCALTPISHQFPNSSRKELRPLYHPPLSSKSPERRSDPKSPDGNSEPGQDKYPAMISSAFTNPRIVRSPILSFRRWIPCSATTVPNLRILALPSTTFTW